MIEPIQSLATLAGLGLGLTYDLGGLIVSIHLSRYEITDY